MLILIVVINLLASSILGLVVGWKLGLIIFFGGLPPLVFSGYLRMKFEAKMNNDSSNRFAESAALAGEAVAAIRTVASLAIEQRILENFGGRVDGIVRNSIPSILNANLWFALSQSFEYLILALGFW